MSCVKNTKRHGAYFSKFYSSVNHFDNLSFFLLEEGTGGDTFCFLEEITGGRFKNGDWGVFRFSSIFLTAGLPATEAGSLSSARAVINTSNPLGRGTEGGGASG